MIIEFVPNRDLTAQKNLENFIYLARDQLTIWKDIEGFDWSATRWSTTSSTSRFTNFENTTLPARTNPTLDQLMHSAFLDTAKACLRYRFSINPQRNFKRETAALRLIEYALRLDMDVPDITKFCQRHWDLAVSSIDHLATRSAICSTMHSILNELSDFYIVTGDAYFWKNPFVGRRSYSSTNGENAPFDIKAKKTPNQDALLAIAEVFSRGETERQRGTDILITCTFGLLLSAPTRIGEFLRLRTDCLRDDFDSNNKIQFYLAYWVPKTKTFTRKPVPETMLSVTKRSINRLTELTEEGRRLAKYMETETQLFYRHPKCPDVPDDQILTITQVVDALGYSTPNTCSTFFEKHTGKRAMSGHTLNTLWKLVLKEHKANNPHFPYQENPKKSKFLPLKMSESLFCFRQRQLTDHTTSPVLLAPFRTSFFNQRLTYNPKHPESNFFFYHGYGKISLKSHSVRHLLNRLSRSKGVSIEVITEWSSRATVKQSRTYLNDDPDKSGSTGAVLLKTTQEQHPQQPITNEEAEIYSPGPFHRSRYGICRRSWRIGPCNKFADCLNCSELVMCKGDKIAAELIEADKKNFTTVLDSAELAISNGEQAATRWIKIATYQLSRINELLNVLNDPNIPNGSPIEIIGTDFNHEEEIISKNLISSDSRSTKTAKLGVAYSDELLACLDLIWKKQDA